MRLGTLARKLDKNTDEIIAYLIKNGIIIEDSPNTKLDQMQLELIHSAFQEKPAKVTKGIVENPVSNTDEVKNEAQALDAGNEIKATSEYLQDADEFSFDVFGIADGMEDFVASVHKLSLKDNDLDSQSAVAETPPPAPIESPTANQEEELSIEELAARADIKTLRAKKVKLNGIKVVGKIDLPEPKKKVEESTESAEKSANTSEKKEQPVEDKPKGLYGDFVKNQNKTKSRKQNQKGRNKQPLTFEEKQKREEQRLQREKEREKKALKKKKEAHYKNTVLSKVESSAPKIKKKKTKNSPQLAPTKSTQPKSQNPLKKLWAWLNGEYDNF